MSGLKQILKKLDFLVLNGKSNKIYRNYRDSESLRSSPNKHKIVARYNQSGNFLAELFYKYGSDKGGPSSAPHPTTGWQPHSYSDFYEMIFRLSRHEVRKVFECGIGTNNPEILSSMGVRGIPGASLRAWRDYFPNAIVIGADIDSKILFSENRIKTYCIDQTNPESINNFWKQLDLIDFDIVIDDGLHLFEAGKTLFENSIRFLRDDGIYIIEDILQSDKQRYMQFFEGSCHDVYFIDLIRPNINLLDNSLIMISKKHNTL